MERFSSRTSSLPRIVPGDRSRAATTTSARSSAGSGRNASNAAKSTRIAAAILRASTVRAQSGRSAADMRCSAVGSRGDRAMPSR
ncbi:Uncharacterised protein [Mycobacteroides abscessus subsp. abscessus]|nr:Uncharacterised protein [Mycobacteroides abscessus subsp. abscessus]